MNHDEGVKSMFDQLGKYLTFLAVMVFICGIVFAWAISAIIGWIF